MFDLKEGVKILAVGAHPDDIELSCGGSLLRLNYEYKAIINTIICSKGELKSEPSVRIQEQKEANEYLKVSASIQLTHSDGSICSDSKLVNEIEEVVENFKPDLIFTHWTNDIHQDHRNVGWSTLSAARRFRSSILFYPSLFTRDKFVPNLYIDITDYFGEKLKLLSLFKSQSKSEYMLPEVIKIRAEESGLSSYHKYAEQFVISFAVV